MVLINHPLFQNIFLMKYLLKCFFLLLILAIVGCPYQSEEICFEEYQINIPITLFPQIDTFKLGDTIWIESLLSHALVDLNHDSLLNISNFSTNTRVGIFRFDTIAPAIAFDYFQYLNEVGEFQVFTRFIKVSYDITENQRAIYQHNYIQLL